MLKRLAFHAWTGLLYAIVSAGSEPAAESTQMPGSGALFGSKNLTWRPEEGGFKLKVDNTPDLSFEFPSANLLECDDGSGAFCPSTRKSTGVRGAGKKRARAKGVIRQLWHGPDLARSFQIEAAKYRTTSLVQQMSMFYLTNAGGLTEVFWDWKQHKFLTRFHYQGTSDLLSPRLVFISAAFGTSLFAIDSRGRLLQRCYDDGYGLTCENFGAQVPASAKWLWKRVTVRDMDAVRFQGPIVPSSAQDGKKLYLLTSTGKVVILHFSQNFNKWKSIHPPQDVQLVTVTDGQSFEGSVFAISADGRLFEYNLDSKAWDDRGSPDTRLASYEGVALNARMTRGLFLVDRKGQFVVYSVDTREWRVLGTPENGVSLNCPPTASQLGHMTYFFFIADDGAMYSYDLDMHSRDDGINGRWTKHGLYRGKKLRQERVVALTSDIIYAMTENGAFVERSISGMWGGKGNSRGEAPRSTATKRWGWNP